MNPDDMRGLFNEALDGAEPVPSSGTDDIVAAGKRRVLRRRAAIGAGAVAGIAVFAAAAAIPMVLSGGPPSVGAAGPGSSASEEDVPEENSCEAPDDQTEEQRSIAAVFDQELDLAMTEIGGTLGGYCLEGAPDYDGFHFDAEAKGYLYEEAVIFLDSDEHAMVRVAVLEPDDTPTESRMQELADCGPDVDCAWDLGLNEEGPLLLLVEETRTVVADADEKPEGDQVPVRGVLLEGAGGFIVHIELEESRGTGELSVTTAQLAEVAKAMPVGQEAPASGDGEETEGYTLPGDAVLAQAFVNGIAEQYPGAAVVSADEVVFVAQEDTEAYAEGYWYGNDNTRVAYADATVDGEQVRFFLQVTPLESPGDGGASQGVAEHYANCPHFECEYSALDDSTALVHRDSVEVRPGPTSIELRAADGWVVGVGAESRGSTEAPSIDFAALDAIVNAIR